MQLMDTLQHDLPSLETQIPPIHEQFTILEKYEVSVPDSVSSCCVWSTRVKHVSVATDCRGRTLCPQGPCREVRESELLRTTRTETMVPLSLYTSVRPSNLRLIQSCMDCL